MMAPLIWLLAFHIAGLATWCASLLYLPALLLAGRVSASETSFERGAAALNRFVFTTIATPAALFAIASGSALFLLDRNLGPWLVFKLTAVTGMVVCHALYGLLILRQERKPDSPARGLCLVLAGSSAALILAVLWLVLAKPI